MKSVIVALSLVLAGQFAKADGFVCTTDDGLLKVKVYNQTEPSMGTRNPAVMVVSDPMVQVGNKTIAVFRATSGTLLGSSTAYTADVDLRFTEIARKGENIYGTKLGHIDQIHVDIDFSYAQPVAAGKKLAGELSIVKRNGDSVVADLVCKRYLKN